MTKDTYNNILYKGKIQTFEYDRVQVMACHQQVRVFKSKDGEHELPEFTLEELLKQQEKK